MHYIRGDRVAEFRQKRGYSLEDIEEKTGIRFQNISAIEHGKRQNVTVKTLKLLCEILMVSSDYLIGLSDEPRVKGKMKRS